MCGPTESFSPAGPGMETISVSQNESTPKVEVHKSKSNNTVTPGTEGNFEKKLVEVIFQTK